MAGLNPESLIWLDHIETLRAQPASATRADLQKAVNRPNSQISVLLTLKDCLTPADIEKIKQAASSQQMPYTLSYRSAQALAGLKGKVWDHIDAFHAALEMTLSLRLTTMQIKALVEWIADEQPLEDFDPKKVKPVRPARSKPSESKNSPSGASPAQSETPEDEEEDLSMTWKEKYEHAKKTNAVGWFYLIEILPFVILGCLGWLVWKVLVWIIHLF